METRSKAIRKKRSVLQRTKTLLRTTAELDPVVGVRVVRFARRMRSQWRKWRLRKHDSTTVGNGALKSDGVLRLAPRSIVHSTLSEFHLVDFKGEAVPGEWDKSSKRFSDLDIYVAMKQVLKDRSCGWTDTEWYKTKCSMLEAGERTYKCRNEAELQKRLQKLEQLYASIRDNGYKSQTELTKEGSLTAQGDEVAVAVGRSGEILFCDGAHRLCAALLLGIDEIPVQVAVRHPLWSDLRKELLRYAMSEGGHLYQPALHPDLAAIPSLHGCEDRWNLLAPRFTSGKGSVLDIGANLGFFDHRLEDLGYKCMAVENDPMLARFMTTIRDATGHHFDIIAGSILERDLVRGKHFSAVLALNIFHHFLKTKREYGLLGRLLHDLECDEMFFEPHKTTDSGMVGAYAGLDPDEFTQYVAAESGLTVVKFLGQASDGRSVYHLSPPA